MRPAVIAALALLAAAAPARAHLGHLGEVAGHDHWVAGAAIGLGIAISLWGLLKGKGAPAKDAAPEGDEAGEAGDDTPQEA
jgi:hypothetical protein